MHTDSNRILFAGGAPARVSESPEILLVNDDPDLRLNLAWGLGSCDLPIVQAGSGAEALARCGPMTAVVIVDAVLPDASGFEICAELKSRGRGGHPFVLVRTASPGDPELRERLAACEADGVLGRGAEAMEVATVVRALLRAHAAEARARRVEEDARRREDLQQELLAIAGHDLRTPLQVIKLAAASLRRSKDPSEAQPHLERIERSTRRAVKLVNDLLDLTQAQLGGIPLRPVWMDLAEVVRDAARELQAAHPDRQIEIASLGEFCGAWDPDRLTQVVSNLVHNAIVYGAPDVPVRVGIEQHAEGVALTVWNRGPTIDPSEVPGLFLAFRRGLQMGRNGRGLGIGLYLVERIVHAHGGEVSVRSSPEFGTEFTVLLPRIRPAEA